MGASRFVAGETMAETVRTVKELNADGMMVTLDLLGEGITTGEEAAAAAQAAIESLDVISAEELNSTISVKLPSWGWHRPRSLPGSYGPNHRQSKGNEKLRPDQHGRFPPNEATSTSLKPSSLDTERTDRYSHPILSLPLQPDAGAGGTGGRRLHAL